jgi:small conductance mechanosensitive channel
MPRRFKSPKRDLYLERMFETRSEAWERAGLSVGEPTGKEVKRAQRQAIVLIPLLIAVLVAYNDRVHLFKAILPGLIDVHVHGGHVLDTVSIQTPLQIATMVVLVAIGWALARDIGRAAGPTFLRRMDPATAGTVGFLVRLATIAITLLVALGVAGLKPQTLAVGGAFTAVVLGLAAQQTLGNVIAGMVLLSAHPFRVGERVRFQAGAVGGSVEGTVSSLGLLYTTLTRGYDRVLVPNNVVLAAAVVPLKEPDSVDVKVRLSSGVRPSQVQAILDNEITIPTRSKATVLLEEVDGSEVVVRVQATPELAHDGAKLADEVIAALSAVTGEHARVDGEPTRVDGDPARVDGERARERGEHARVDE